MRLPFCLIQIPLRSKNSRLGLAFRPIPLCKTEGRFEGLPSLPRRQKQVAVGLGGHVRQALKLLEDCGEVKQKRGHVTGRLKATSARRAANGDRVAIRAHEAPDAFRERSRIACSLFGIGRAVDRKPTKVALAQVLRSAAVQESQQGSASKHAGRFVSRALIGRWFVDRPAGIGCAPAGRHDCTPSTSAAVAAAISAPAIARAWRGVMLPVSTSEPVPTAIETPSASAARREL